MTILRVNIIFSPNVSNSCSVEFVDGEPTDIGVCGQSYLDLESPRRHTSGCFHEGLTEEGRPTFTGLKPMIKYIKES